MNEKHFSLGLFGAGGGGLLTKEDKKGYVCVGVCTQEGLTTVVC